MSNKPVTPWDELEGRFFKVDVGSTTADAIASDHQTGEPVVHYTTDGQIVFNGMKFCQQGGAKRFNKLIVHKAIPMTPEKGNFYYFYDGWIKFKVDLDKLDDSAVFRFPSVEGLTISDENIVAYPNTYDEDEDFTFTRPFKIENIEGKKVADIKKQMLSKEPYANRFLLVRYIRGSKHCPTLVTTTRNVNLYNITEISVLNYIRVDSLHQFMVDRGCCFASKDYRITDNMNGANNRVVYCATPNVPHTFKNYLDILYGGIGKTNLYRYKRKRKFYHKLENGIRKKYEVTRNGRKTYFRVRTKICRALQTKNFPSSKNFSFVAYLRKYRMGGPISTEEVKVIIWNDNGAVKIKKF